MTALVFVLCCIAGTLLALLLIRILRRFRRGHWGDFT